MKKKITYVLSDLNRSVAFEWVVQNLNKHKIELTFILVNCPNSHIEFFLKNEGVKTYTISYHSKFGMLLSIFSIVRLFLIIQPHIIHTHLRDASFIGQIGGRIVGIKRRIYTRHHSTFHQKYFPKAVWLDKLNNYLATDIVAISGVVKDAIIREGGDENKILKAYHGFDFKDFNLVTIERIESLKEKYLIEDNQYPVIGVISRYIEWKGHQFILPAFKSLLKQYPKALLIIANAKGPYRKVIESQLESIPPENLIEITFEKDLFALYKLFDVFVHCPVDKDIEAFGQIYVESLASGVPSVFALSGIANEFIEHGENALLVPNQNSEKIKESIEELIQNKELSEKISKNGMESVKGFSVSKFISELEELYEVT